MKGRIKVLSIGPMPPPSGGVSVHLSRLLRKSKDHHQLILAVLDLRKRKIYYSDDTSGNIFSAFFYFLASGIIHIHLSHPVKVFIARLSRLLGKFVVYTQHNQRELLLPSAQSVIRLSSKTIFVFQPEKLPENGVVIPAYIQSDDDRSLPAGLENELSEFKNVIVSVRSDSQFESGKEDLYGFDTILEAVRNISFKDKTVLVLADPSGTSLQRYENDFNEANRISGIKIIYIDREINFPALLSKANIFIRASRSDGDSVSVREALNAGVLVLASDCVARPEGCKMFKSGDSKDLCALILKIIDDNNQHVYRQIDYSKMIFELYINIKVELL